MQQRLYSRHRGVGICALVGALRRVAPMRTILIAAGLAVLVPWSVFGQAVPVDVAHLDPTGHEIHAAFSRYAEYGFSGSVFIEKEGRPILHAAYGWADREQRRPLTTDVALDIQSATKPVVASMAAVLAHAGQIPLDTRLGSAFPQLPGTHRRVTLQQLLSHTSGLMRDYEPGSDGQLATIDDAIRIFGAVTIEAPGKFEYRNLNYAVAKALMEHVAGLDFRTLLRARVLGPAGAELSFDRPPDAALGYDGMPGAYTRAQPAPDAETYAGGTLWGNAGALAAWEGALDSGDLVPQEWVETLRAPVSEDYALGWFVYPGGMRFHGGDGGGFQAVMARHPGLGDLVFVVLMNVRPSARDLWWRTQVTKAIQFWALDRELPLPPSRVVADDIAGSWEGTYIASGGDSMRISREADDGGLVITAYGPGAVSALGNPEEELAGKLALVNGRSAEIGNWLHGGPTPPDELVAPEEATRLRAFLHDEAPDAVASGFERWEVLGSAQASSGTIQTFVSTAAGTVRLVWSIDALSLVGWGLGGESPGALAAGLTADGHLFGYVPGHDQQIAIEATRDSSRRVTEISIGAWVGRRQ